MAYSIVLHYSHFLNFISKHKRKLLVILWMMTLVLIFIPTPKNHHIRFMDVGQGDGIMIRTKDQTVITIDGGSHSVENIGEKVMIPSLREEGVRAIDYAIISHLDIDHYSGILDLLKKPRRYIRHLVLPDNQRNEIEVVELLALAKDRGTKIRWMKTGDYIKGEDFTITCLYEERDRDLDRNSRSLALDIQLGKVHCLSMGDSNQLQEEKLIQKFQSYHPMILKVNHHGSKSSTSPLFLDSIKPKIAIISCGRKNLYGHPHEEVIRRLRESQISIFRTDELWEILVVIGEEVYLKSFENPRKIFLER